MVSTKPNPEAGADPLVRRFEDWLVAERNATENTRDGYMTDIAQFAAMTGRRSRGRRFAMRTRGAFWRIFQRAARVRRRFSASSLQCARSTGFSSGKEW